MTTTNTVPTSLRSRGPFILAGAGLGTALSLFEVAGGWFVIAVVIGLVLTGELVLTLESR